MSRSKWYDSWEDFYSAKLKVLGKWIETDEIPDHIKWAVCEVALKIFDSKGDIRTKENQLPNGGVIQRESLKSWSIFWEKSEGSSFPAVSDEAVAYLFPFVDDSCDLFRQ